MKSFLRVLVLPVVLIALAGAEIAQGGSGTVKIANGAAAAVKADSADFQWEFSIRDGSGKSLRTARMKAEGTAALRDKERGSCMYKFLRKETLGEGNVRYFVEENCAVSEEMARGNATVSNTKEYSCQTSAESFDANGMQSCASTVDTRTGKQFHCECKIKVQATPAAAKQKS